MAARSRPAVELVDLSLPAGAAEADAAPWIAGLRSAVRGLAPRADQEEFSGRAADTLAVADGDPYRSPFAIVHDGAAVGFGVLDAQGYRDEIAGEPGRPVLLRAFYVAAAFQGRGLGGAAIARLPEAARTVVPDADTLMLTVNVRNAGARAAYLAGGFVDAGDLYLGGDAGPQHILRMALASRGVGAL
ncbi:GNAT family N-acetyltransferase [Uniformispora flossi]|uniref:GNAT family N-acetyltransferase n=1 Tax=Uniformispora flossi TaxID=3390723 RepID=UPI003C2BAA66